MAASKLLPGFKSLGGKSLRVLNEKTGEIISRRQYAKIKNAGLTNEQLADLNRVRDTTAALSRPARGRSSLLKFEPQTARQIAEERLAAEREKKTTAKIASEQRKVDRRVETEIKKRVHVPKITRRLLKPGTLGRRVPFNDYEDLKRILSQAKNANVFSYGLGLHGVDQRDGRTKDVTVFSMKAVGNVVPETVFYEEMGDALQTRAYLVFLNYFVHLAFDKKFAESKMTKSKSKVESKFVKSRAKPDTKPAKKKRK